MQGKCAPNGSKKTEEPNMMSKSLHPQSLRSGGGADEVPLSAHCPCVHDPFVHTANPTAEGVRVVLVRALARTPEYAIF